MKIIYAANVREYLKEVSDILYEKEYFGFEDDAAEYIDTLTLDIDETLPNRQKKKATPYFNRYGKGLHYSVFKKNDNTQWYVFFNYEDDIYYIRYIGNNHTCAQYL
ncbi:MAG: hypothetical protein LBQ74_12960 [Prevotella sp.]|jgi:hypothetical protein|nr:hypothetical protein [Prevotella sp.]